MHQDAFLLAICANKKWQDAIGKEIWIGELEILDRRPANVLRPKTALIGLQQIVGIICELFCGKQADNPLDSAALHKSKPLIERFMRYACKRESRAARAKNDLLTISGSTKTVLWVCRIV